MDHKPNIEENTDIINNTSNNADAPQIQPSITIPEDDEEMKIKKEAIKKEIMETKEDANSDYKNGNFVTAFNKYSICIKEAENINFKEQLHILYFNKGLCYTKMNDSDKAIEFFTKSLEIKSDYEKALNNRMITLKNKGEYIDALSDLEKLKLINDKIITYSFEYELRNLAEKKKQEMQQEMLGQLKDVGNKFLGLFGLSTNNFKVNQSDGGGYNISFQQ